MHNKIITKCIASPLTYIYYKNSEAIPEHDWNSINDNACLFFDLAYLKIAETTLSDTIEFTYILFYDKKTPVAFAITQLFKFNSNQLNPQDFPCKISDSLKNKLIPNLDITVLTCGNLFACGEYGFKYNSNLIDHKTAFNSLTDALRKLSQHGNEDKPSFILLKEFWPDSFVQSDHLLSHNYREFKIDTNMVVYMQKWSTFDEYLASMRTKFRTRAKAALKKSNMLVSKNFKHQDIEAQKDIITTLYTSVLENSSFKIGKQTIDTFKNLAEKFPSNFIFKGYFLEEKLVAFSTAFKMNAILEANHIGIDYKHNKSHAIYQRMLYDYVDMAIENKVSELRLGRTAEIIKSTVGAIPVDMKLYIRHRNSISNKLLKPIIEFISPNEYEIRQPFKQKDS